MGGRAHRVFIKAIKFEYLYAELGGQDGVHIENLPGGGISDVRLYQSTSFRLNVFRAGLNYHL